MSNEHIDYDLLSKYLDNEASTDERQQVDEWVASSDANAQEFTKLKKAYALTNIPSFNADMAWNKLSNRISEAQPAQASNVRQLGAAKSNNRIKWFAAAAVVLIAAIVGLNQPWKTQKIQLAATEEINKSQSLPDGSTIDLNTGSTLTYSENSLKKERQVTLSGEAFFDVHRDESKPFVITTEASVIKVLGTSFNVNTNGKNNVVEIFVRSGRVSVTANKSGSSVELVKGEKAVVYKNNGRLVKLSDPVTGDLFWKTRTLEFKDTELDTVIGVLQNIFKIKISLADSTAGRLPIRTTFENEKLEDMLSTLAIINCLQLETKDQKTFILHGKGCN
ncbi:MAG: FecR domain-containing protein [Bacteroidetes bacterium]|nr:FecR domain-containing protein [Bacteroidota bacterium]